MVREGWKTIQWPDDRLAIFRQVRAIARSIEKPKLHRTGTHLRDFVIDNVVYQLFDEFHAVTTPEKLGTVIHPSEVPAFKELGRLFAPVVGDLGNSREEVYLADPRWPAVVEAARVVLAAMEASDTWTEDDPPTMNPIPPFRQ